MALSLSRPARTAAQGAPAWVATEMIDAWAYDMTDRQYGITVLFLTMMFSWGQAAFENWQGSGFLREDLPAPEIVEKVLPKKDDF